MGNINSSSSFSDEEMGLLSNRLDRGSLKPGDHIYSWRTAYIYAHHGIYVGDNKVIHFTRPERSGTGLLVSSGPPRSQIPCPICSHTSNNNNGVTSSCLDCFLAGGVLKRYQYSATLAFFQAVGRDACTLDPSDPPETTVHRANYLLTNGFGCYDVLKNNCEVFAIYCKTGKRALSGQVVSLATSAIRALAANRYGTQFLPQV